MQLWIFSSKTTDNIERGFKARKWAVSDLDERTMDERYNRSRKMTIGSYGLLYCSEDQNFTLPFITQSKPELKTIGDIWSEPWALPFEIQPMGSPERRVHLEVAKHSWEMLRDATNTACRLRGINGRTIFLPNEIVDEDWRRIIKDLGFREQITHDEN